MFFEQGRIDLCALSTFVRSLFLTHLISYPSLLFHFNYPTSCSCDCWFGCSVRYGYGTYLPGSDARPGLRFRLRGWHLLSLQSGKVCCMYFMKYLVCCGRCTDVCVGNVSGDVHVPFCYFYSLEPGM